MHFPASSVPLKNWGAGCLFLQKKPKRGKEYKSSYTIGVTKSRKVLKKEAPSSSGYPSRQGA
jgi:hypothetical protein